MQIVVEFFGIPRERTGFAETTARGTCLGDLLLDLAKRYPRLAQTCIEGRRLKAGYVANLGGEQFVSDPETRLVEGSRVLLLSLDAGG